jgi:hypothetical protein
MDDREKVLQELSDLAQEQEAAKQRFESKIDTWWDNLSPQDREWAFYSVCKRIYKGEIVEKGSYRYVLYDVFGFDKNMYVQGMDCGFMALHNSIINDKQFAEANKWITEYPCDYIEE